MDPKSDSQNIAKDELIKSLQDRNSYLKEIVDSQKAKIEKMTREVEVVNLT